MIGSTLVALGAVTALVALAAPATAEPAAGLTLTVAPAPSFVVGSQGRTDDFCGFGQPAVYSEAEAALAFRATSPSGIAGYDVRRLYAGQGPSAPVHRATNAPLRWSATNYSDDCGGGSLAQTGWRVTAHDKAGHSVSVDRSYDFTVTRWNNRDAQADGPGRWSLGAGWTRSACACADGGSQAFSTTRGSSGSYTARLAGRGSHLGLMMATGPDRGRADVYVDGVHRAVVDTSATQNRNRVYVWDSGPLAQGDHVVRVVNQATAGRPRIDVNAMGALS